MNGRVSSTLCLTMESGLVPSVCPAGHGENPKFAAASTIRLHTDAHFTLPKCPCAQAGQTSRQASCFPLSPSDAACDTQLYAATPSHSLTPCFASRSHWLRLGGRLRVRARGGSEQHKSASSDPSASSMAITIALEAHHQRCCCRMLIS